MWQLETHLFASYVWLAYIFEASYSTGWRQSAKNQGSTNQNSRNRWCLIVRRTIWKGQFRKTSTRPRVKMFRKNYRVKRGKELFLKTKKVLIKICNISHLLSCKLPRKFISWVSRKTKIPNCIVFFFSTNHRVDSHRSTPTTSNITFQLRRTWSFCKYGLVLFLSLVYLVNCSVSVVIF